MNPINILGRCCASHFHTFQHVQIRRTNGNLTRPSESSRLAEGVHQQEELNYVLPTMGYDFGILWYNIYIYMLAILSYIYITKNMV